MTPRTPRTTVLPYQCAFTSLAAMLMVGCATARSGDAPSASPLRIIDTHIHLYDPTRPQGVPWPPPEEKVLYRPVLPEDFRAATRGTPVTHTVIVEASEWVEDNQWVLDVTRNDSRFLAFVGNLDPFSDDFAKNLDRFAKDPRFVGIRLRTGKKRDIFTEPILANMRLLAKRGLSLDVLTRELSVDEVDRLATLIPDLRIIIDHLCGYPTDGRPIDEAWAASVRRVAKHRNVYCKVSALFEASNMRPSPKELAHYRPIFDVLWHAFGEDRLIYGSNWPVELVGGEYIDELRVIWLYFELKGSDVLDKVMWRNAVKAYRLDRLMKFD